MNPPWIQSSYQKAADHNFVLSLDNKCKVIRVEYAYNHIQVRPVYNKQR